MSDFIRELVSQNKIRYKADGYDLDLTYITPNIIAMGFPARNFESVYRNDADEVIRFLDEKHPGRYFVINLCSERDYQYHPDQFHGRACTFPIADHGPPPFHMFMDFCRRVEDWLRVSPQNVVAVHCRAGKDRTGTMLAAYFLYSGMARTAEDAIYLFTMQRTYDGRKVMIPSQKRYVKYFETLISPSCGSTCLGGGAAYQPIKLLLTAIIITPPPTRAGFESDIFYTVQNRSSGLDYTSNTYDMDRDFDPRSGQLVLVPPKPLPVCEDVKVGVYGKSLLMAKEELFRFWFNTFFVPFNQSGSTQQQVLSGGSRLNPRSKSGSRNKSACTSCQSNQQYLSEGPSGNFVSVVRLSNTGPSGPRRPSSGPCGNCCCGTPVQTIERRPTSIPQGVLTLHKSEMEGGDKIGPQNLTVTLFFSGGFGR